MNSIYRSILFFLVICASSFVALQSSASASNDEDKDIGLGGTGILSNTGSGLGGTGIVGEITGFGSIFVNGIEVEYDKKTPFSIDGETTEHQQLEIGDIVEVLTVDNKEHTQALMINIRHEVIGKVESINEKTLSFKVNGQTVIQAIRNGKLPDVGTSIAVSGFRIDNKTILSTRVVAVDSRKTLVRTQIELPFKGKTTRWLVQTHIEKDKAIFKLDGSTQRVSVKEKSGKSITDRLGIRILELQKTKSGNLLLQREVETGEIPRGRAAPVPTQLPGNNRQGPAPGPRPMNNQFNRHQGGITDIKKPG